MLKVRTAALSEALLVAIDWVYDPKLYQSIVELFVFGELLGSDFSCSDDTKDIPQGSTIEGVVLGRNRLILFLLDPTGNQYLLGVKRG